MPVSMNCKMVLVSPSLFWSSHVLWMLLVGREKGRKKWSFVVQTMRYSSTYSHPRHQKKMSGWLHIPAAWPPVRIEYLAVWASEPVWSFRIKEQFLAHTGIQTSHRPVCGVVAIPICTLAAPSASSGKPAVEIHYCNFHYACGAEVSLVLWWSEAVCGSSSICLHVSLKKMYDSSRQMLCRFENKSTTARHLY